MRLLFMALLTAVAFGMSPAYADDDDDDDDDGPTWPFPEHPLFKEVHDRVSCDGPGDTYKIKYYMWDDLWGWVQTGTGLGSCGDAENSPTAPGQ